MRSVSSINRSTVSILLWRSTCVILFAHFLIFAQSNLVVNGDFTSVLTPWVLYKDPGTTATGSVISQEFRCTVTNGGTQNWNVQLYQDGIALEYGKAYELTFSARSDQVRKITVGVGMGSGTYEWYDGTGLNISATMQEYKIRLVMRYTTDNNARLMFQLGVQNIGVYLDNISLKKVSDIGIAVLRPQWNDKFPVGSTQEIHWWTTPSVISNVKIDYSADFGQTWVTEQASTPNDGSYIWTVPNTIGTQYIFRITDAAGGSDTGTSSPFIVIQGGPVSLVSDVESGDNTNNYCYWWYYYSDIHGGGNSQIVNGLRVGTTTNYQPPIPKAPGNSFGTGGHCMNLTFAMGSTRPKNPAGTSYPNYVGMGTMVAPDKQFTDMSGVIGFQFWSRASQQMVMVFQVESGSVIDTCYHRDTVIIDNTWKQYQVLIEDLFQPSWGNKVAIDLSRLRVLEFMVSVENNPALDQAGGWYEVDDVKAIGFVPPTNIPPSFTSGGNVQVAEDAGPQNLPWTTAISAGETGQTLTFNVANDNTSLFSTQPTISSTGALSFTSASNANGIAHMAVVLRDNGPSTFCARNQSDTAKFTLSVISVNDTPRITSTPPTLALEDSLYRYQVVYNDPDKNDTLIYKLDSCPTGMTINSSGLLQWKPGRDMVGRHTITLKVFDRDSAKTMQTWEISVSRTRSIALTSPKNGDIWIAKSTARVAWSIAGVIDSINIMLTLDTGKTWIPITKTATKNGEFSITVPDTVGNYCKLRVRDAGDSVVADTSDGYFLIKRTSGIQKGPLIPLKTGLTALRYNRNANALNLNIALAKPERISARFVSLQGRMVGGLPERALPAGYHAIQCSRGNQSSGPLLVYIRIGQMEILKMVVIE